MDTLTVNSPLEDDRALEKAPGAPRLSPPTRPDDRRSERITVSVVVPMHNEEFNLGPLLSRLTEVLGRIALPYEVICVDDGSRDATWATFLALQATLPRVKGVRLSRNFGKEVALTAGLKHASGQAVVLIDADLQHPPELIAEFVERWRAGAQMVIAVRQSRDTDPPLRRMLSRAFYRVMDALSEVRMPEGAGDFRLLDRKVVDALTAMPERSRFMKGLYSWVGFRTETVPYEPAERNAGRSTFGFARLTRLAFDGIVSFSTVPLRMWSWIGLSVALVAVAYGLVVMSKTLLFGIDVPGYASLMVTVLFLGGVQLICLGVLGDYLGRVFTEVKGRPLYFVADVRGFHDGDAEEPSRLAQQEAGTGPT